MTSGGTRISIAMATWNGARYLEEQLDSFARQTRLPDELVVRDDQSEDETLAILDRFRSTAPFEVSIYQNQKRLGYARNFEAAMRDCTGHLIFLSDQDDVWFTNKLERMESAASHSSAVVLMNDAVLTDSNLNEAGLSKLGQLRSAKRAENEFVMGCCIAVRKSFLDLILPMEESYPAHDDWIVQIARGAGRLEVVEEPMQYYRRHGSNESTFFVNKLTSASRADSIREKLAVDGLEDRIRLTQLLLAGVQTAAGRAEGPMKEDLSHCAEVLSATGDRLEARNSIRQQGRLARVPAVTRLYLKGGYTSSSGLLSAIRDIVGR